MRVALFLCLWLIVVSGSIAQDTISNPNSIEKIINITNSFIVLG